MQRVSKWCVSENCTAVVHVFYDFQGTELNICKLSMKMGVLYGERVDEN